MAIFDYECPECEKTTESIEHWSADTIICECGGLAKKITTASGVHCGNEDDTSWAKHGIAVMPKDSPHRETQEFLKNPTKRNYRNAMKAEGVRFMEPGEKAIDRSKQRPNIDPNAMAKILQRRRGVEVHG